MGIKAFNKKRDNVSVTEVIRETLEVSSDGSVSFRARRGKGSGKPLEISGEQFDTFVSMMNDIAARRESLAETAKKTESTDTVEDFTNDID